MTVITLTERTIEPVGGERRRRCSLGTWIEALLMLAIWAVWILG